MRGVCSDKTSGHRQFLHGDGAVSHADRGLIGVLIGVGVGALDTAIKQDVPRLGMVSFLKTDDVEQLAERATAIFARSGSCEW